jgi:hypothetical protein
MAASVKRFCPKAEFHLLTNNHSRVPAALNCSQAFRLATTRSQKECFERLMLEEVEYWKAYFSFNLFKGPTVLIDVDLLIKKPRLIFLMMVLIWG